MPTAPPYCSCWAACASSCTCCCAAVGVMRRKSCGSSPTYTFGESTCVSGAGAQPLHLQSEGPTGSRVSSPSALNHQAAPRQGALSLSTHENAPRAHAPATDSRFSCSKWLLDSLSGRVQVSHALCLRVRDWLSLQLLGQARPVSCKALVKPSSEMTSEAWISGCTENAQQPRRYHEAPNTSPFCLLPNPLSAWLPGLTEMGLGTRRVVDCAETPWVPRSQSSRKRQRLMQELAATRGSGPGRGFACRDEQSKTPPGVRHPDSLHSALSQAGWFKV